MSDYTYYLIEDIEEAAAKDFAQFLATVEDGSIVTIQMLSHGGLVFAGLGICQMIAQAQGRGVTFTVNVYGIAASAASDVTLACDHIYMAEGSQIMIHSAYGGTDEGIVRANQQQIALIHKRMPDYSEKDLEQDQWYDAAQAVSKGLADGYISNTSESRAVSKLAAYLSTKPTEDMTMAVEELKTKAKAKAAEEEEEKKEAPDAEENEKKDAPEAECGDGEDKEAKAEEGGDLDLMEAIVQRLEGIEHRLSVLEGEGKKADDEEAPAPSASARRKALMQKLSAVCAPMPSAPVKTVAVSKTPEDREARCKAVFKNFDEIMKNYINKK